MGVWLGQRKEDSLVLGVGSARRESVRNSSPSFLHRVVTDHCCVILPADPMNPLDEFTPESTNTRVSSGPSRHRHWTSTAPLLRTACRGMDGDTGSGAMLSQRYRQYDVPGSGYGLD